SSLSLPPAPQSTPFPYTTLFRSVYADAYRLRLIEALAHNYPRLQQLLGEEEFSTVARSYLDEHPSRSVSVRWFGNRLAVHLGDRDRKSTRLNSSHVKISYAVFCL